MRQACKAWRYPLSPLLQLRSPSKSSIEEILATVEGRAWIPGTVRGLAERPHVLYALLEVLEAQHRLPRDPRDYTTAISSSGRARTWHLACGILEKMPRAQAPPKPLAACCSQVVPSVVSFGACIAACEKSSQWLAALEVYRQMLQTGLGNLVASSAVLSACGKAFAWRHALALCPAQPDVVSYSAVMSACERGSQWRMALQTFQAMRHGRQGLRRRVRCFRRRVRWFLRGFGHVLDTFSIVFLDPRLDAKLSVDLVAWNTALAAVQRAGRPDWAQGMLEAMLRRRLRPNVVSAFARF